MGRPTDSIGVHARLQPERLAAHELTSGQKWSFAELDDLVARVAAGLLARGCKPGDRVAVLARNSVLLPVLHFACGRAGLIYAPLNWRLNAAELTVLTELADPRLTLSDGREDDETRKALHPISLSAFTEDCAGIAPLDAPLLDIDRPSLILFTSGTSGRSKGVIVTERNLLQTAINFGMLTRVDNKSIFLCDAPMFHVIGLVTNLRPVLMQGGAIRVSDGFDASRTLERLADPSLAITHYAGVPQMMEAFRRQPSFDPEKLRHMTALVSGGAPHSPADLDAWLADGIPLVQGFGMSEAGTVFGMPVELDAIRRKRGSAGIGTPTIETRLVDSEGREVANGEPGELLLRGPSISPGYWRNPEETAKAIDAEGWFATGDVARCDEDGFFWIVDRRKDMYISGGENVYPAEIEALLVGYPGIAEYTVVGLPDPRWGESGCIAIVPNAGATIDETELLAFLAARLARHKLPKTITILETLPRTSTGKIQKAALRAHLSSKAEGTV